MTGKATSVWQSAVNDQHPEFSRVENDKVVVQCGRRILLATLQRREMSVVKN